MSRGQKSAQLVQRICVDEEVHFLKMSFRRMVGIKRHLVGLSHIYRHSTNNHLKRLIRKKKKISVRARQADREREEALTVGLVCSQGDGSCPWLCR